MRRIFTSTILFVTSLSTSYPFTLSPSFSTIRHSTTSSKELEMTSSEAVSTTGSDLFRIRTVTAFITLQPSDFTTPNAPSDAASNTSSVTGIAEKIQSCATLLRQVESDLVQQGYEVQTVRVATNPFPEYLLPTNNNKDDGDQIDVLKEIQQKLSMFDDALNHHQIEFCALGPASNPKEVNYCPTIVSSSHRFSCSAEMSSGCDLTMAKKISECMKIISQLGSPQETNQNDGGNDGVVVDDVPSHIMNGLGNFRFCGTACCKPFIPFFPGAKAASYDSNASNNNDHDNYIISFAIGLENGKLAKDLLAKSKTIDKISTTFKDGMAKALEPIQELCNSIVSSQKEEQQEKDLSHSYDFVGFDTSLNPSLDENGSVAEAMEQIETLDTFGGRGTLSIASEITTALQSLPNIQHVGYCGLMLPVCEDRRLAQLASDLKVTTTHLLSVSSVCGVGLDTVPLGGKDVVVEEVMGLVLDVAGLAFRWDKQLSCRLLLCPGQDAGDEARFGSPYMCDCRIFDL